MGKVQKNVSPVEAAAAAVEVAKKAESEAVAAVEKVVEGALTGGVGEGAEKALESAEAAHTAAVAAREEAEANLVAAQAGEKTAAAKAKVRPEYVIAKGHALTVRTKILGAGDAVTVDALEGGKVAFDAFVKSGHIVKNAE